MSMENPPVSDTPRPEQPQASKLTTIVLIVSLVLVIVIAGVLGAVAVLMTRSPDAPLLGAVPPLQLATPIHFAPVRESKEAPCPGEEAVLDELKTTCYLIGKGVTVNAVQQIETVAEDDGTYSVRIAMAPAFKTRVATIIQELAGDQRPLAVVLTPPNVVVAAPSVLQAMDGDSVSIGPLPKAEAEALAARLGAGGTGAPTGAPETGLPGTGAPTTGLPDTGTPNTGAPNTGAPNTGAPNTGTGAPNATTPPGTGNPNATTPAANTPVGANPTGGSLLPAKDKRHPSCKEAVAAGLGPYTKGRHTEYTWYVDKDNNGTACNSADL
ncbi:excalibur calcium-binding domain-containing protein [Nonomuraea sp. NPDC059023]|uniref:excalibur calcium-binding domain-containing protein n=1 Tax=unclassified Nonomuraea TaxID=2593643 RepID=UPI00369F766F